jgi:nucleotide-binding universal stress UspA family protein
MTTAFGLILVGEDESEPAEAATQLAVELAAREPGSHVVFCHVVDTSLLYDRAQIYDYDAMPILGNIKDEMGVVLARAADLAAKKHVDCEQLILDGNPLMKFLELAQKRNANLIVIGSHGRRGLQRLFLGSFAEHVVRRSHCPVLIVRDPKAAPTFQHVLVPVDGSRCSSAALDLAILTAKTHQGKITVLYALDVNRYVASLAGSGAEFLDVDLLRDSLQATGRAFLDGALARIRAQGVPCDDRIDDRAAWEAIDGVASDLRADVIIMGTHGRHGLQRFFLGSTTERVLRSSTIPVMVVRASE